MSPNHTEPYGRPWFASDCGPCETTGVKVLRSLIPDQVLVVLLLCASVVEIGSKTSNNWIVVCNKGNDGV